MPSTRDDRVREVVAPVVTDAGLFLEEVRVSQAGARSVVKIVVDLDEDATGGLDLDALSEVSQEISTALDGADDAVPGKYVLEVTTPGTDRPLTELRHFKRARGRLVRLELVDGGTVTGRLVDASPETFVLRASGAEKSVAVAEVRRGRVEVELNRSEGEEG